MAVGICNSGNTVRQENHDFSVWTVSLLLQHLGCDIECSGIVSCALRIGRIIDGNSGRIPIHDISLGGQTSQPFAFFSVYRSVFFPVNSVWKSALFRTGAASFCEQAVSASIPANRTMELDFFI